MIVCAVFASVCSVYYLVMLYRVSLAERTVPDLRTVLHKHCEAGGDSGDSGSRPRVAVVIPAHNESAMIARSARSLADQSYAGGLRVVYVLDRCTDGTGDVLRESVGEDERFSIVVNESCPAWWSGKTHACWRGVQAVRESGGADLLLFADADCWFESECVEASVVALARRRLGMLSLLPTLTNEQVFEKVEQPAAGMELMRQFPLDQINRRRNPRRFANGQFMLFRRDLYEALGGHEAVKDAVLEDLAFARRARNETPEHRIGVLMSGGLLRCQMYEDRAEFRRGWKRIYQESSYCRAKMLGKHAWRLLVVGVVLPTTPVLTLGLSSVAIVLRDRPLAYAMQISGWIGVFAFFYAIWRVYRLMSVPGAWVVAYPLGALRVWRILREAAGDLRAGRRTEWAGLRYARTPTDDAEAPVEEGDGR